MARAVMVAGYLLKENQSGRHWDRRYFELVGTALTYWQDHTQTSAAVIATLSGSVKLTNSASKPRAGRWPFTLEYPPGAHSKGWTHITLTGETREDTLKWIDAIRKAGATSTHDGPSAYRATTAAAHTHAASHRRVRFGSIIPSHFHLPWARSSGPSRRTWRRCKLQGQ